MMLDKALLARNTISYTEKQLEAISKGFCPHCLPKYTSYRILKTYFDEHRKMDLLHVKCDNLVACEWDEQVPAVRVDNGLEGFFNS
ncbi:hypothetical protein [Ammoniphilus sp. CFH 90114]|uniref:hypothetical protein n=1 Tax=Ammoniphilus sp. CFH 90114 TaxID=2493665 RepID=UPI00100E98A6|nr:hypothetical protein [Ammoniphilus sp. CFH 90114]RXT02282.1 hypothetical protein EIZ39_25045 [Ammoniphilus sp. CFH 90114]